MLLKSLRLKNVRSYSDARIDFPLGSTLLSGDIGSGKSTLLIAIDFALFGIRRGEITGPDLLRHGCETGEIELEFLSDGREINVKRVLKKRKDSINQEPGYLSVNGYRNELTPTELTAKILDLIGYPQEMLRKNRPIFRYTVYTPQEEMKQIIENEGRLETLRKIFDVDKYGTIKSNVSLLLSAAREEKKSLEGYTKDLEIRKEELLEKEDKVKKISSELENQSIIMKKIENEIIIKRNETEKARKDVDNFASIRKDIETKEKEKSARKKRRERNAAEIKEMEERAASRKGSLEKYSAVRKPDMDPDQIKAAIESGEKEKSGVVYEKSRAQAHAENLKRIHERGICEVCGQPVHDKESFAASIQLNSRLAAELSEKEEAVAEKIASLRKKQMDAKDYLYAIERRYSLEQEINEIEKRRGMLSSENAECDKEIAILERDIGSLESRASESGKYEKILRDAEKRFDEINAMYITEQRKHASMETELRETAGRIAKIREEIEEKKKAFQKIEMLNEMMNWLGNHFTALMDSMEKNVMLAIQREFDGCFQKWFSLLMSDALAVRIDEQFTPIIEQNGYETEYRNLSGGEKTSVALAYRLALNRVINDMIHSIKTKDLLILDEPTDGFSTEQLDRIREVLNELKLKQVVIVSHEPKIDTYVDNVIRIYKEDHTSRIAA
ncbi:MAG: AAA family ATPase [Candidatus Aenigmarchaeota archaeon]|nr:AAA family ATPase [Candidatus Aenigmarchaeota archaeon]